MSFSAHLREVFGDNLEKFLSSKSASPYIRINPMRTRRAELIEILERYGFELEASEGLEHAIRIDFAPFEVTLALHHYAGYFVKQSLASQLPAHVLAPKANNSVLDLCAAPGSKTTHLGALMQHKGRLLANELNRKRMIPLAARVDANIVHNCLLLNSPAERLAQVLSPNFDAVLADVPCSGLGEIDNLPENKYRFEKCKNFDAFYDTQYSIALAGAKLLKCGGKLLYSTCSLNPSENEAVVNRLISRLPLRLLEIPCIQGIHFSSGLSSWKGEKFHNSIELCNKILPWENDSQGFFIALLEKYDELPERYAIPQRTNRDIETLSWKEPSVREILENIEFYYGVEVDNFSDFRFIRNADKSLHFMEKSWDMIPDNFHRAGICLAKRRGGMWKLSHSAVQFFGSRITKNLLHLSRAEILELADSGTINFEGKSAESPYPVVAYEGLGPIATANLEDTSLIWKKGCAYRVL